MTTFVLVWLRHIVGQSLVKRRPLRNGAARSRRARVKRFVRLINTDGVFGTHTRRETSEQDYIAFMRARFSAAAEVAE